MHILARLSGSDILVCAGEHDSRLSICHCGGWVWRQVWAVPNRHHCPAGMSKFYAIPLLLLLLRPQIGSQYSCLKTGCLQCYPKTYLVEHQLCCLCRHTCYSTCLRCLSTAFVYSSCLQHLSAAFVHSICLQHLSTLQETNAPSRLDCEI